MPAPFHQIVAVIYVLRRLVICTSVGPLLVMGIPIALRLLHAILSLCVGGDDRSILLVAVVTVILRGLVLYCQPLMDLLSTEIAKSNAAKLKLKDSQRSNETNEDIPLELTSEKPVVRAGAPSNRIRMPLLLAMFALSTLIVRSWERSFLLRVVRKLFPNGPFLLLVPTFSTSLSFAFSMMVLGSMVAARFFGPTSIARFSTFPVISNPWDVSFQQFLQKLWSGLLLDIRGPESAVTVLQYQQAPPVQTVEVFVGRRFQRPTLYTMTQHIVLALVASMTVAYVTVFPLSHLSVDDENERSFLRSVHLTSCILTLLGSLLSILDGVSHEINPLVLLEPTNYDWYTNFCRTLARNVICTAVIVPAFSILLTKFVLPGFDVKSYHLGMLQMHIQLTTNCILIAFYVTSMDEIVRTSLFHPRPNLTKMANELSDETPEVTLLGVMLNSLLCDSKLVQQVVQASVPTTMNGPERDELKRSEELTKTMARVILTPRKEYTVSEAPLEEDVLRILLLEILGGGRRESERQQRMIHAWIDRPVPRRQSSKLQEPLSCLLVRGLCIFIGGIGEALMLCSQSSDPRVWKLSPSFFCSAELAMEAVKRCLVRSFTPDGTHTLCDWKCSHLSIQVPSALTALHQLRRGVVRYGILIVQNDSSLGREVGNLGTHVPLRKPYGKLVQKCDSVALSILQSMKSLRGLGRVDVAITDRECLEWKTLLLARNEMS